MHDDLEICRISQQEMVDRFTNILEALNFPIKKAQLCARIFTESSVEGVYTHGVNRFPRFVQYIRDGHVKVSNEPTCLHKMGSLEQWDGHEGAGIVNAIACTDRAMVLAKANGIGCVALRNTNHWMRGGSYGWHAAKQGFAFIGWTNTVANMAPWGTTTNKLGNNPLVMGIPYEDEAIILDMAVSQFSYGSLEQAVLRGDALSVPGGHDRDGNLSTDPAAILETKRVLPAGFWKGSGLSFLLDVLATVLTDGLSTRAITEGPVEAKVSQVFIAIDIASLGNASEINKSLRAIVDDYKEDGAVYPGERAVRTRKENQQKGIPVLKAVWDEIMSF